MSRQLSATQKIQYLPILIKRQGGFICLYCKKSLTMETMIYEHLNRKRTDNRIENLALAHQPCNIEKITNLDYQIIANEQLKFNEDQLFVREKNNLENGSPDEVSKEIDINVTNSDIVEQFVSERVNTDRYIEFADALDSCVFLCKKKTGHGSHQAVRNYIKALTSTIGPFMLTRDEKTGKKIIVRRTWN